MCLIKNEMIAADLDIFDIVVPHWQWSSYSYSLHELAMIIAMANESTKEQNARRWIRPSMLCTIAHLLDWRPFTHS